MHPSRTPLLALLICATFAAAQQPQSPLKPFLKEDAPVLVLDHVRIIDGTGSAPTEDQRIDIANGKITNIQSAKLKNAYPANAKVLDLTGKTVIPGLVGMHEHLFYPEPREGHGDLPLYNEAADSAPRLYLAAGVTTARTAGSMEPYTDLNLKKLIDTGQIPGPSFRITGPYIGDYAGRIPQMHTVTSPEDAARLVDYWTAEGATSFKAYMYIKPEELKAAIDQAHKHNLKITGHLCSVGFTEAASLGIDNLEHGIVVDTEFFPGKQPGICPDGAAKDMAQNLDIESAPVQAMIKDLVAHHVAITSTLAVFEVGIPNRPSMAEQARVKEALTPAAWSEYVTTRAAIAERNNPTSLTMLKKEMQFERDFVKAGGLLQAGADPTSYGGVLAGYADQRGIELLVEAGFTPLEAIQIATKNGATYLGEEATIGTISQGKSADIVVLAGNPADNIHEIEKVETVLKQGIAYDPEKLTKSVQGLTGLR
jgi:imidazolonepropionase-like amidohydrolase